MPETTEMTETPETHEIPVIPETPGMQEILAIPGMHDRIETAEMPKRASKPKPIKVLSPTWADIPSSLKEAGASREACTLCGYRNSCNTPYMPAWIPKGWTGKLVVILDFPSDEDDRNGRPGSGETGGILYGILANAGFGKSDIAVVPALRCRPTGKRSAGKKPSMRNIRACRPFLLNFLRSRQAEHILVCGDIALSAVLNAGGHSVMRLRGRPIRIAGVLTPIYATYSPSAAALGGFHIRERIVEDVQRLSMPVLPWPKEECPTSKVLGLDTEFTQDGRVLDVAVADSERSLSYEPDHPRLGDVLKNADRVVCHSLVDIDSLVRVGLGREDWVRGLNVRDSLLISRMADENRGKGGYELENLFLSLYRSEPWKYKTEAYSGTDATAWPYILRAERCRIDAWAGLMVAKALWKRAHGPVELNHRIAMILQRIYHSRAYVDLPVFERFERDSVLKADILADQLHRFAAQHDMVEFVPHNPGHVRKLLYEKLKLHVVETTKAGLPSVGKIALKQLHGRHPVVEQLLAYSKARKIQTTYVTGLRERFHYDDQGRPYLRVQLNPLGAKTGRRASGKNALMGEESDEFLNFQNFPKSVRPMIVSRWNGGYISDNDYSKLEIILHGRISGEDTIVEYFTESPNGYIEIGKRLFKREVREDTDEYRATKAVLLGIQYNMSAWELARQLFTIVGVKFSSDWDEHLEQTERIHRKYLSMFPKLRGYMEQQEYKLNKYQYVDGWLGQRRRLPLMPEPPKSEKLAWKLWRKDYKRKLNQAINFPTQWAASLVTGTAMLDIEERLLKRYGLSYLEYHTMLMEGRYPHFALLINEVHDDLVYDLHPETWRDDMDLISCTMRELPTLRGLVPLMKDCPINVGQKVGTAWGKGDIPYVYQAQYRA
jgi:uracil-DNA glycosylase family 4